MTKHTTTPALSIACILMASGQGKRFDGNKLLADFHGQPLFERILSTTDLPGLFTTRLVLTIHPEIQKICCSYQSLHSENMPDCTQRQQADDNIARQMYSENPFPNTQAGNTRPFSLPTEVLLHSEPNRNDAIRLGIEHLLPFQPDGCMFCPGDQPLLSQESLSRLVNAFRQEPKFIWRLSFEEKPGSPVIFPARLFPELMQLPEKKGGSFLIKKYPEQVRTVSAQSTKELMDVDTRADLEYLISISNHQNHFHEN